MKRFFGAAILGVAVLFLSGCSSAPLDKVADQVVEADTIEERTLRFAGLAVVECEILASRAVTAAEVTAARSGCDALSSVSQRIENARAAGFFESEISAGARVLIDGAVRLAGRIEAPPDNLADGALLAYRILGSLDGARAGLADLDSIIGRYRAGGLSYAAALSAINDRGRAALAALQAQTGSS